MNSETTTGARSWTISKSRHDENVCDECVSDSPVWYSDNHGSASVAGPDTDEITVWAKDDVLAAVEDVFALARVSTDFLAERFGVSS